MFQEGMQAMFARMTRAGWIESALDSKNLVIRWTASGRVAAQQFGLLFEKLGPDIGGHELIALLYILASMSPSGSDSERNALD